MCDMLTHSDKKVLEVLSRPDLKVTRSFAISGLREYIFENSAVFPRLLYVFAKWGKDSPVAEAMAKRILKRGGSPNEFFAGLADEGTAVHRAIEVYGYDSPEKLVMLTLFLEKGSADLAIPTRGLGNKSAINAAASKGCLLGLERALAHCVKTGKPYDLNADRDAYDRTPLHNAVRGIAEDVRISFMPVICLLMRHGADPDLKDHEGKTAFEYAATTRIKTILNALPYSTQNPG